MEDAVESVFVSGTYPDNDRPPTTVGVGAHGVQAPDETRFDSENQTAYVFSSRSERAEDPLLQDEHRQSAALSGPEGRPKLMTNATGLALGHGPAGGVKTLSSAVFLMCCMSLGVGVFMMPTVLNQIGIFTGVTLIIFFGVFSTAVMLLVLDVAYDRKCSDWDDLVKIAPLGLPLCNVGLFLGPMIGNMAHIKLVGGMLFDMLDWYITKDYGQYTFTTTQMLIMYTLLVGFALPYTFLPDMGALSYVSQAVSGVVITTSALVVTFCVYNLASGNGPQQETPAFEGDFKVLLQAIPTICFAFTGMLSFMDLFGAVKTGVPNRAGSRRLMRKTMVVSGVLVTVLYLSVAIAAIGAFGKSAGTIADGQGMGNVLYNFPVTNYIVTIFSLMLVIVIVLDYPIIAYPVIQMLLRTTKPFTEEKKYSRHVISVILAVIVVIVPTYIPNLTAVMGLCGSLGISIFCYVLPGMIILVAHPAMYAKVVAVVSVLIGATMLFVSTFFIIQGILKEGSP